MTLKAEKDKEMEMNLLMQEVFALLKFLSVGKQQEQHFRSGHRNLGIMKYQNLLNGFRPVTSVKFSPVNKVLLFQFSLILLVFFFFFFFTLKYIKQKLKPDLLQKQYRKVAA